MSARHGSGKQPSIESSAGGTVPRLAAVSAILYWLLTVVTGLTVISTGKYSYQNDSTAHWLRVEQLRAGTIVPQLSQDFPGWVVKDDNGIIKPFNNTAVNSPFAYLPSLIIQGDYKASSIATLLIASGIIALAIWLAREFRYAILATAILPMTFFSLTFPTADAMINSISLLFIAVVLCCYQSTRFGWLHVGILSVLAAMLGQVKITCILVSFFVFVLLGKAKKIPLKIALVVPVMASIASMAMWNRKVAHIATAPSHVSIEQISQLKKQMMADPFSLIGSWFQTFFEPLTVDTEKIDGRLVNAGRNLQFFAGTEAVQLANAVVIPVLLAIAILVIVGASQRHLQGWKEITVPALVSCAYFAATCTAMLIAWAGKSSGYASGIQNRYFVPILPLLFLLVPRLVSGARNRTVFATVIALTAFSYFGIAISFLIDWK